MIKYGGKMFTFAVITYNQQEVVLETLESIKYQIENFGFGLDVQLVIADDGSSDNTISIINYWILKNAKLFKIININTSEKNAGISQNYIKAIKMIKGDTYKVIAGDDIFSKNNIFESISKLEKYDFWITGTLFFKNYKIIYEKKRYKNVFLFFDIKYKIIKRLYEFTFPFYVQGVFHKIRLIDKNAMNFIRRFKMVEDHPELYYITQNNDELSISFSSIPYILYRESESTVTKSDSKAHNILYNDIKCLYKLSIKKEKNLFYKYAIWCSYIAFQNSKLHRIIKYISPLSYYKIILAIKNKKTIKNRIDFLTKEEVNENQTHIEYIYSKARKEYKEFFIKERQVIF